MGFTGLTTADVAKFIGGQIEIQNQDEGYIYRGEIASAIVENNELKVKCAWLAKGEGTIPFIKRWVKDNHIDYTASLEIYSASNIGPSSEEVGGGDRLCLNSPIVGELVVLIRPTVANSTARRSKGSSQSQRKHKRARWVRVSNQRHRLDLRREGTIDAFSIYIFFNFKNNFLRVTLLDFFPYRNSIPFRLVQN